LGVNVEAQAAKAAKGTAEVALIPDNLNLD
jgi:hypothetical protein